MSIKENLRKVIIEERFPSNRPGVITKVNKGFFHKWFDGFNQSLEVPIQYALIEFDSGETELVSIEDWKIKFV